MENILDRIKEKKNQIDVISNEIKDLENEYANLNTKFQKGDVVTHQNIKDTSFTVIGNNTYSHQSDIIFVDCSVLTTTNNIINKETVYSLPEIYLNKK